MSWLGDAYGWVDKNVAGGNLPGGHTDEDEMQDYINQNPGVADFSGYQSAPQIGGFGMSDPFSLGNAISGITGNQVQPMTNANQQPGAFSQLGDAIGSVPGKIGGAIKGGVGAVGDFIGWDDMKPMEKAQVLAAGIGGAANIYSAHKAGQQADDERERRQRSAAALRPYIQNVMSGAR